MKIEIYNKNWTKEYVSSNKNKIFVFGDNNARVGKGGQATIRGLENTVGIRTKKGPSKKEVAFYTDKEFADNKSRIDEDILNIKKLLILGNTIVFSKNGYGTGLASLKQKAPKTFDYLCESLKFNFGFDNEKGTKWSKIPGYDEISKGTYINLSKKSASSNEILQPTTNSFFRSELLDKNLNTIFDLIKNGKKIAFTHNKLYKNDSVLIFVIPGLNEYLVVRVSSSYKIKNMDKQMWSLFEGYDDKYTNTISDAFESDDYYQTHFSFICSLDQSGKMIFRDDIFGGYDKPKVEIDKKGSSNTSLMAKYSESINEDEVKEDITDDTEESTPLIPEVPEVVEEKELSRKELSRKELLDIIEDLKKPWYKKISSKIFRRKSIEFFLEKMSLKGELKVINPIDSLRRLVTNFDDKLDIDSQDAILLHLHTHIPNKRRTYYRLVTHDKTYLLIFYRGFFSNKVHIISTKINIKD